MDFIVLGITSLLGLYMAWNIGANDVANSMGNAVGAKALTIKQALIAAGICEFAGAVLVGSHVAETMRSGITDPKVIAAIPGLMEGDAATLLVIGMAGSLLAAALWLNIATWTGMPVSTTHAIVGALAGFGLVAAGVSAVNWVKMGQIIASWFISPVVGGVMGFLVFKFISGTILGNAQPARAAIRITPFIVFVLATVITLATINKGLRYVIEGIAWMNDENTLFIALGSGVICSLLAALYTRHKLRDKVNMSLSKQLEQIEQVFVPLVVISSCSVAFAHGSNDVANAIGPLAAVAHIIKTGTVTMKVGIPFWVMVLGGSGIVFGLATYGHRVMETVGSKITEITPSRGVAADIAATFTVLACTRLSLPISTTHTLVGAIMGIGLARGFSGINSSVTRKIFTSWFITVPAATVVSIILFLLGRFFLFDIIKEIILSR